MFNTMEGKPEADGIYLHITKSEDGKIDYITEDYTPFSDCTMEEIIELIELENRLFIADRIVKRRQRKNREKNRFKIAIIKLIKEL